MKNLELIQHNIDNTKPLTQELINTLENKIFSSQRVIVPGDKLLFAFLSEHIAKSTEVKIISFHPQEYGTLYEAEDPDREIGNNIPALKFKQ